MKNDKFNIVHEIPQRSPQQQEDPKAIVSHVLNFVLKVGAGYLARILLDLLGL